MYKDNRSSDRGTMSEISTEQFLKQAFQLQSEKHYKSAIEALYKALCIEPENIEILSQISHLYFLLNNFERSLEYAEKILELSPEHAPTLLIMIKIFKISNEFQKAKELAEKLFNSNPTEENFLLYIELLNQCGEYEKMLSVVERTASKNMSEKVLSLKAYANLKLNKVGTAIDILTAILRLYPNNYDAKLYLGIVFYNQGRLEDAEKMFNKILDNQQCDKSYNYLGLISIDRYQIAKAIDYFQFAVKISPTNSIYQFNLGTAYSLNGWFLEAENAFKKALSIEPENVIYSYSLSYLYYQQNDYKKALEKLEDTLKINPAYADAVILKSLICARSGDIVNSKNNLLSLLNKEKNNDFLYYALAMVYKYIPIYKDAINYLQQALFIKPESLEYLSELADCYAETGDYKVAQDIIAKVLYLNKHFIYAHLLKAKIELKQGEYQTALKIVENVLKLDNSSAEAYKYLSMIYAAQGLKNKSIEAAKTAVTLQPANKDYYVYLASLYFDAQEYENAFLYYKEASILDDANIEWLYKAAISADKNNDFQNAALYYSYALRIDPFNNLIIYEYVDLLVRNNKVKQAIKLLKMKIASVDSKNIENLLKQKYDELKSTYKLGFWDKIFSLFKRH